MARNASQTPTFEGLIFFFARQIDPLIKKIIFQKHCFNGSTPNNNLHILYEKAMKFNMYEMMYLTKTIDSVPYKFFIAQLNGSLYATHRYLLPLIL